MQKMNITVNTNNEYVLYIYMYIYIYGHPGISAPHFLNVLLCGCVSKSLSGTTNFNIMILSSFKFTAQDNANLVFLIFFLSQTGECQIRFAGQQKWLVNVVIHSNLQFRWQAQWIWRVPIHWQGQWKWRHGFKFDGRDIHSTPLLNKDVTKSNNNTVVRDDIEDTSSLAGLTQPTKSGPGRH